MNLNQIINMVLRILMRKAIIKGVNAGIDAATGLSRRRGVPMDQQLPDEAQGAQAGGNTGPRLTEEQRRAKRAVRMARRASRMTKL